MNTVPTSAPVGDDRVVVHNPFDGAVLGHVPRHGPEDVDRACLAAQDMLDANLRGRIFPQHARAATLDRAAALLEAQSDAFARLISSEAAKPITAARGEVARCIDTLRFSAAEARSLVGEMVPMEASEPGAGRLGFALRVPLGVIAAITPFNFPLNLVAHKVAPAIAAGCPVVLKPAPQTPLTSLRFVALLEEAGMPDGWVQTLTDGGREAGEALVSHPVPRMVTFTGSVGVGWAIAAAAPKKRIALELGSNAPVIVTADADVDLVARKVRAGGFSYAGQSCISVQRVLVDRTVHAALRDALTLEVSQIVVGDPAAETTEVGPMISERETERLRGWIDDAAAAGATVLVGGKVDDGIMLPTVIDNPPADAALCRREAFGPVVVIIPFDTLDEAFAIANDTDFGLHASIFTDDLGVAMRAVRELDFGGVVVNDVPTVRVDQQPYGGVRDAGNTREGPAHTVREMTELRFVSLPLG
ncbi:Aldehyde dehydrogenase [Euzebya pacifica]|uniref:Aldehyde dehydrogenase n=1 Tax=Euzebya pacifica TaxID=1608957 RepID=A0A346Y518_9ACTN|nr:aldehyde dehydrogenase family protein [Euzebya pacifica]AXV09565.1 Aldehyde dehydrogenase [Euzebya pacifica]